MDAQPLHRAEWRKSTHSGQNGSCIEVARNLPGAVAVRDSKDCEGPKLTFRPLEWHRFATQLKAGTFHLA